MDLGKFLLALGGLASVLTILSYLGIAPNGPQIVRRIKAWVEEPHKLRETLDKEIEARSALDEEVRALKAREAVCMPLTMTYPRAEPNAQARQGAYPLGDPRNADATFQSTLERLNHPF